MDKLSKVLEEVIDVLQHTYSEMPKVEEHTGLMIELSQGEWEHSDYKTWRAWSGRRRIWGLEHHGVIYFINSKDDSNPYTGSRICKCSVCQTDVHPTIKAN